MITRDYILRMVEQLAAVVARVMLHREAGRPDEALKEIDDAGERLIGMKWSFLRTLPDDQLVELFGREGQLDKLLAAAEFFRMESELLFEQGEDDGALLRGIKAFKLFMHVLGTAAGAADAFPTGRYNTLLEQLDEFVLPTDIRELRFHFHEITGRFAKAEDDLFELLEENPALTSDAKAFFLRLLLKTDSELLNGGLTRDEVLEGLEKLQTVTEQP